MPHYPGGEHAPRNEMLSWAQYIQREYDLSNTQLVSVLLDITKYFQELSEDEAHGYVKED